MNSYSFPFTVLNVLNHLITEYEDNMCQYVSYYVLCTLLRIINNDFYPHPFFFQIIAEEIYIMHYNEVYIVPCVRAGSGILQANRGQTNGANTTRERRKEYNFSYIFTS